VNDQVKIDPVLVSILGRALRAITDEMSISMEKTTRSPILCEARDFVTGLYDAEGRMLEQTENLPILAFSLAPVCKHIRKTFDGGIHPGDVFFHNDVFSLGNQNNDVAVFKPVFVGDVLSLYAQAIHVGRSSMTIKVRVSARRRLDPEQTVSVTEAEVVFVALGEDNRPAPIFEEPA